MAYPNPYGGYPAPGGYPVVGGYPVPGYSTPSYPGSYPVASPKTYYLIKTHLGDLVLDVEGGSSSPGARVITYTRKNWGEWSNQLWFDDPMTGTIRSKATGHCLDLAGDTLVVNPHYPGNPNQLWERYGTTIRNRHVPHRVIDVAGANRSAGARVISFDQNGGTNQQFDFVYVPGLTEPYTRRDFFIVSEMHNKVLDISGVNPCAGAGVIVWPKKSPVAKNQLWYFDPQGVIHSALNDMVLETQGGTQARVMPFLHHNYQQWTVAGNRVISMRGECLDIQGAQHKDGAAVLSFPYKGSSNQHWRLEFV